MSRALRPAVVLLVLLAPLLAGCAEEPEEEEDPLLGLCPQWMQGPGQERLTVDLNATGSTATRLVLPTEDGALREEYRGRSLDLYRFRAESVEVVGGTLEMRAFGNSTGEQKAIRDYRVDGAQLQPSVRLDGDDAGREFDIPLTPISQETAPVPEALVLSWRFVGEGHARIVGDVTFHYRVCGADL